MPDAPISLQRPLAPSFASYGSGTLEERPWLAVLVSDREWPARALEGVLRDAGYDTLRADTADRALALCAAREPDLVFVEQRLADPALGPDGREARPGWLDMCRRLRESGVLPDAVPLLVTTADTVRRADVLDALGAGAWDLCALPGDPAALLARCAVWVRGKRHADRAADSALTDPETGLYNLRGLLRRTRELASAARRADQATPVACIALRAEPPRGGDEDPAGGAARRVRDVCATVGRASDVFARVGGRDLAILAPGATADGAERLVERLRGALEAEVPRQRAGVRLRAAVRCVDAAEAADDSAVVDMVMRAVTAFDAPRLVPPALRA